MSKKRYQRINHEAEQFRKLKRTLQTKKHVSTELGRLYCGTAAALVPQASHSGLEQAHSLLVAGLLADAKVEGIELSDISQALPKRRCFRRKTNISAIASTVCAAKSLKKAKFLYLTADKGNKQGMEHFPKIVSWYDEEERRVKEHLLDIDVTDKTSEDAAKAIVHSLQKLFPQDEIVLHGIVTDSGGGGTLESLGRELEKLGVCSEDFLILSCSLHNLQTCLRAAVLENLGEGGKATGEWKRNAMQLIFGVYNIQGKQYHEPEELKKNGRQ